MNPLLWFISLDRDRHLLLPPAGDEAIAACEARLGWRLPASYVEFLRSANGALLYESEELFGVTAINEGIGSLSDVRSYAFAEGLPEDLLLFNDDGRDAHAFETSSTAGAEPAIVGWSSATRTIGRRYAGLADWVDSYLVDKWSPGRRL